jgi:hypothetical protein
MEPLGRSTASQLTGLTRLRVFTTLHDERRRADRLGHLQFVRHSVVSHAEHSGGHASGLLPNFLYSYVKVNSEQNAVVVTAPQQMLAKIGADLRKMMCPHHKS